MAKKKLKFQGNSYLLVNERNDDREGALATQEQLANFDVPFAHLLENGKIMQFGKVIGERSEIEWEEE